MGQQTLLAHSANEDGQVQPLLAHLEQVARKTADFAAKFGAQDLGWATGLLHDTGKASSRFQSYLAGIGKSGGDHKNAGAQFAMEAGMAHPVAFAIAGHHGGLPALANLKSLLREPSSDEIRSGVARMGIVLPGTEHAALPTGCCDDRADFELFVRFLFSALVDADYLDTQAHFDAHRDAQRGQYPDLASLLERFMAEHERRFGQAESSAVNRIRSEVFRQCLAVSEESPGAFSLTVPTGGGKTLSSAAFALAHGVKWGSDRVIVVIPYTSIIEQTADNLRSLLGPENVIEHHSAVSDEDDDLSDRRRLAAENWDAPVIVTTAVQFFESLFANQPSRCRKLHNIARSVVIIDEVQTLPLGLLLPTFQVLSSLVQHYSVSLLLTTATQPAYDRFSDLAIREIVPDPPALERELRRVEFERAEGALSWDEVASRMTASDQSMAVVNTRADARSLFAVLPKNGRVHLSTNLCGAHRREVLADVRRRLSLGAPCRLATTQLVEAGVDIDFPVVLRAAGPLEAIVQAAGRCNREGRLAKGTVILFDPADGGLPPGSYRTATMRTQVFLNTVPDAQLGDPRTHSAYFRQLYQAVELDARGVTRLRESLDFPAVATAYRVIDEESVPVAVPWGTAKQLLDQIARGSFVNRDDWRAIQPFLVNLRRREWQRAQKEGLCGEVVRGSGLWRWEGGYDHELGLQWEFDTLIF